MIINYSTDLSFCMVLIAYTLLCPDSQKDGLPPEGLLQRGQFRLGIHIAFVGVLKEAIVNVHITFVGVLKETMVHV